MSTQQKLTTFLRHFLYSRGKSESELLGMTLNKLFLKWVFLEEKDYHSSLD